jgi:hypothetical protein
MCSSTGALFALEGPRTVEPEGPPATLRAAGAAVPSLRRGSNPLATRQEPSARCHWQAPGSSRTRLTHGLPTNLSARELPSTTDERDKRRVDYQKTQGEIVADEAAHKTAGAKTSYNPVAYSSTECAPWARISNKNPSCWAMLALVSTGNNIVTAAELSAQEPNVDGGMDRWVG